MERRNLRYLVAIAERGSISAAARSLRVSQPTLSESLARMEEQCGFDLVRRSSRGITLTDAGRRLTEAAHEVLYAYEKLDIAVDPETDLRRGQLTVVCPRTLARVPAAAAIGRFRRDFPAVAITMLNQDSTRIAGAIASGHADVGLGVDEVFDPNVRRTLLGRQRVVAVVGAGLAADLADASLASLVQFGLITTPRGGVTRRLLAERLGERTVDDAVTVETFSAASMMPLVRSGAGVAFLPESGVADFVDDITVCHVEPELTRDIWMFHRERPTPAAAAFYDSTIDLRESSLLGIE